MKSDLFLSEKNHVFRVSELNFAINQLLKVNIPLVWVRGEISNFMKAASGHCYFSLKDDQAQVRCVMFRNRYQLLTNPVGNGQQVEILATATLYEQRGDFQLTVEQIRPAGLGLLYEKFIRLKLLLESEGLFAADAKLALPAMPKRIGIITSPQAAALRDVLSTLKLRLPSVPVLLYPVPVQGTGSGEKIAAAIALANQRAECEVLILCRGGGSIEDLWAFNEEVVARAIATCKIPLISGIGHETDFTIADFVADERAPTPTAAAQRAVPDRHALLARLHTIAKQLEHAQHNRLQIAMQAVDYLQRRLVHPAQQLQRQSQQLAQWQQRLQRAYRYQWQQQQWQWLALKQRLSFASSDFPHFHQQLDHQQQRLVAAMQATYKDLSTRLNHAAQQLLILNPEQVLARGYSLVQDANGNIISAATQLAIGDELQISFASGKAKALVQEKSER